MHQNVWHFQAYGVYHWLLNCLTQIIFMTDTVANSRKSVSKVSNMVQKLSHVGLKPLFQALWKRNFFVWASKKGELGQSKVWTLWVLDKVTLIISLYWNNICLVIELWQFVREEQEFSFKCTSNAVFLIDGSYQRNINSSEVCATNFLK